MKGATSLRRGNLSDSPPTDGDDDDDENGRVSKRDREIMLIRMSIF